MSCHMPENKVLKEFDEVTTGTRSDHQSLGSGVCLMLGELGVGATINEKALAKMMGRCVISIKRAVQRGELPPPTKLLGQNIWTVGRIIEHLNKRLDMAKKEFQKQQRLYEDLLH